MKRLFRSIPILLLTALLLSGCGPSLTSRQVVKPEKLDHPRVAVFPFENLTTKEKAGAKVTDYYQALMTADSRFETVPYGETYDVLRRFRVRSVALITNDQIDSIASALHIDYFLTGSVLEYEETDNSYLGKIPQVAFNSRLVECSSKKSVWIGVSNGSGDKSEVVFGLGAVRSADELAKSMVAESIAKFSQVFKH